MKEYFARVDDALIDRLFQPLADWMDGQMGLGTNRAARSLLDLASLAWISTQAGAGATALSGHDLRNFALRGVLVVFGLWGFTLLRSVFRGSDSKAKARTGAQANPLRPSMQLHRALCLLWTAWLTFKTFTVPFGLFSLALLAVGVFATAAVYIGACSNQPPKRHQTSWDLSYASGRV